MDKVAGPKEENADKKIEELIKKTAPDKPYTIPVGGECGNLREVFNKYLVNKPGFTAKIKSSDISDVTKTIAAQKQALLAVKIANYMLPDAEDTLLEDVGYLLMDLGVDKLTQITEEIENYWGVEIANIKLEKIAENT